ncbi:MAG TPA: alginate lyase family protein [Blastocatellia bacterium]|nr:alginate lyase family protein [Blastocatellia bacterium]
MNRRFFMGALAGTTAAALIDRHAAIAAALPADKLDLKKHEYARVIRAADRALAERPGSVTASRSERSAGGPHDFFSEGDYWWPDPKNPGGPYIRRDGQINPDNFNDHRQAMVKMSLCVASLTAGWVVSGEKRYAERAAQHLRVFFLDEKTYMAPHLLYAQAIKGVTKGRGIGIIDTIHLAEVARSIPALGRSRALSKADEQGLHKWFAEYLKWIDAHPNGAEERAAKNNHGSCWVMQAAAFAQLVGNEKMIERCRELFRTKLIPDQLTADGSFPLELARTRPYSYSLFNLDILGIACQILSTPGDDLWGFTLPGGAGLRRAFEFHYPFIADKSRWPFAKDIEHFDQLPVRMPSLLFAGIAYKEPRYIELWKKLEADPVDAEVIRNFPVRQPVLWVNAT